MDTPSSPVAKQVELRDCIVELIKFTLQCRLNDDLDCDLALSRDFCSYLLEAEPDESDKPPLYHLLALALYDTITAGELLENYWNKDISCNEEVNLKQMEQWKALVHDLKCELACMVKRVNFELHVQEPYFTQLKECLKTVEGRCFDGDYKRIKSGALILFNKSILFEVKDVRHYNSFSEMLESEGLETVLPGVESINEGVEVYRKFYTETREKSNGVLAIHVKKSEFQPYFPLARVLSGLNYVGVRCLLNIPSSGDA